MAILTDAEIADLWAAWEESLVDTCTVTPVVAPGHSVAPYTVACAVVQPRGATNGDTGGGNRLGRPADITIAVKRPSTIKTGDGIRWNDAATRYSAGNITYPTTYDPGVLIQCIERSS